MFTFTTLRDRLSNQTPDSFYHTCLPNRLTAPEIFTFENKKVKGGELIETLTII